RIDDDRAALLAVNGDDVGPAGEPEIVVAADRASAGPLEHFEERLRRDVLAAHRRRAAIARERRIVFHLTLLLVLLERGSLLFGQHETVAQARRPLERRHRG